MEAIGGLSRCRSGATRFLNYSGPTRACFVVNLGMCSGLTVKLVAASRPLPAWVAVVEPNRQAQASHGSGAIGVRAAVGDPVGLEHDGAAFGTTPVRVGGMSGLAIFPAGPIGATGSKVISTPSAIRGKRSRIQILLARISGTRNDQLVIPSSVLDRDI